MNCPYCGRPAEDGYIYCGHKSGSILWYPEGADYAVIYTKKNIARHGGVELVKRSSMFDEAATMNVSLCRACGKGFFDLKSEIEQSE